jgi:hypothetical protein
MIPALCPLPMWGRGIGAGLACRHRRDTMDELTKYSAYYEACHAVAA